MSDITIVLRAATAADFGHMSEIERSAARLFPVGRVPDPDEVLSQEALQQGLSLGLLTVACVNDQPVGFTLCEPHGEVLHLLEVAVHADWGQRGIGRMLVQQVIDVAATNKSTGVSLTTFADLPFNAPFYESLGFGLLEPPAQYERIRRILVEQRAAGMTGRVAMWRPDVV